MFPPVSTKASFPAMEEEVLRFWRRERIFERSLKQRQGCPEYVFYDGPPFATGLPHYGHLLAGTIKDVIPRYQTMRGKHVERRFGWDCHGLPVEYEMEQTLKISGKRQIEEYGIAKFNEACRSIVLRYTEKWREIVDRIGRWVDFDNAYRTMDLPYMESIWWVFRTVWDKGLIYEGTKSMPYCPRCATPLSNFEVQQNYVEVEDPALTVRFRSLEEEGTFFLAWTTTPWTLPSNMALAVGPDIEYVKLREKASGSFYILALPRLERYYPDPEGYEIVERMPGSALRGARYEPLFPYFAHLKDKGAFKVYEADFVATDEGTGIVHVAPGFGEVDHDLALAEGIPVVCPVDAEGRFTEEVPDYCGKFVKEADDSIMERLKQEGKLVERERIRHNYPHCWRCDSALIFKAIATWFLKIGPVKQAMIEANRRINWVPAHIKEGRFGKWLEGARDWAISRNRYWGTPLPIWRCSCGKVRCIGSVKELEDLSGHTFTDIHKHFVDSVTVPCPSCGKPMKRVPEVLDCWFESGAMPYAQKHYPFENKEWFEANFPADFIAEGLDQTRGWFYTLVVLGTCLFNRAPFKNVIVNGLVLAENGQKMSKRLKNYPEPVYILNTYGADALRLYLLHSPLVKAEDLRFSERGVQEKLRTILLPLWNALCFFVSYANIDGWGPEKASEPKSELDRWVMANLQGLKKQVIGAMEAYDLQGAIEPIVAFLENLTNWYIRRSRRRFWKTQEDEDKLSAYSTLYRVLKEVSQIIAPFVPFTAEKIYLTLRTEKEPVSVHLTDFPQPEEKYEDPQLCEAMSLVIRAASMGRALRAKHKLKIRQPLPAVLLVSPDPEERKVLERFAPILQGELNVKEVHVSGDEEELVDFSAKANFKTLGPRLGKLVKQVAPKIASFGIREIKELLAGRSVMVEADGGRVEIGPDDVSIRRHQKPGLVVENEGTLTVALDTQLTPELVAEGLAREFVNKVQNMRKEAGFEITDRIAVTFSGPAEVTEAVERHREYVAGEILADRLEPADGEIPGGKAWELNGRPVTIAVKRLAGT